VRLVGGEKQAAGESERWDNRGHFFAAAAEAMRRILTDVARRKLSAKHGKELQRLDADVGMAVLASTRDPAETLALHELLDRLAEKHPRKAQVVKLRYFMDCTQAEAAQILGITVAVAQEDWLFARAWLKREWRNGERFGVAK
jgi:RNA polymerase sigma factor (TIGR02999 family)